jgi:hypothetical protein
MRSILLIIGLTLVVPANSQKDIWHQNKYFVDSLITMYRTKSNCSLTGKTLKHEKKKRRLDIKLIDFLNKFYFGELTPLQIETILQTDFKQAAWRFDEKTFVDSFQIYKGRIRSFGNLEPFVTYIILNNEVVGTHITLSIRSYLDCLQRYDREIPDLLYMANLIPERINFPFEINGWTEYFDSKTWTDKKLSIEIENKIRKLIGTSSATPLRISLVRSSTSQPLNSLQPLTYVLSSEPNPEVCDATDDDSSNAAD